KTIEQHPIENGKCQMKRFAVVGQGQEAIDYIKAIQKREKAKEATLFAVHLRDRSAHSQLLESLDQQGVVVYSEYEQLLEYGRGKIDVIVLPLPATEHFTYVQAAINGGFDVVLEKPLAIRVQEIDELQRAADAAGKYIFVINEFKYNSSTSRICNEVKAKRMGQVIRLKGLHTWPCTYPYYQQNDWTGRLMLQDKWSLDGPLTSHCSDFLHRAFYFSETVCEHGQGVEWVQAELYRAYGIESYDTAAIRVKLKSGVEFFFLTSFAVDLGTAPRMHLQCERANVEWNFDNEKTVIQYHNRRKKIFREHHTENQYGSVFHDVLTVTSSRAQIPSAMLASARTPVLVANLAFESAKKIIEIPDHYCREIKDRRGSRRFVRDMDTMLLEAYKENKLLSEMGLPWAEPSEPFVVPENYTFPQKINFIESINRGV
ncbi:Gfo/Idh/MocA family oxidoreductase, partial [bacterium]|nr:Gfo/Idh/MocA family oxidoreductase [bacterium]